MTRTLGTAIVTLALLLTTIAAAPGAAQEASSGVTWYVHDFNGPTGSDAILNHEPDYDGESDATTTDAQAASQDNYDIFIDDGPTDDPAFTATGDDGEGVIWMKSWNNGPAPSTRVRLYVLDQDGNTVATSGSGLTKDVLNGAIVEFRMPLSMAVDEIPAGTALTFHVQIDSSLTGYYNPAAYPRGVSADHPWQFTLPVAASTPEVEAPTATSEALEEGADLQLDLPFNATTGQTAYTWTTPRNGSTAVSYVADLTAGNVSLTITDAANQTLLDLTLSSNETATVDFDAVTAGNWTLVVSADNATGSVSVGIADPAPAAQDVADEAAGEAQSADDGPADESSDEPVAVPGPGLVFVALAVIGGMWVGRRRHV